MSFKEAGGETPDVFLLKIPRRKLLIAGLQGAAALGATLSISSSANVSSVYYEIKQLKNFDRNESYKKDLLARLEGLGAERRHSMGIAAISLAISIILAFGAYVVESPDY